MLFSRSQMKARAADRALHSGRIAALVRAAFGLVAADGVTVNEIACPDPGCPDVETVILLMRPGAPTRAVKIAKPMSLVDETDVAASVAGVSPS